jgi:hypothetical protein
MEEWRLLPMIYHTTADVSFIGDDQKGIYAYLLPIEDKDGKFYRDNDANYIGARIEFK